MIGNNESGQCGMGDVKMLYEPHFLMKDKRIISMACGYSHSLILKRNGEVWGFGSSDEGQIGRKKEKVKKPTKIEIGEKILKLIGQQNLNPFEWNFQNHQEFEEEIQQNIFTFLLCLKKKIPKQFLPPKPIFSLIINFSL